MRSGNTISPTGMIAGLLAAVVTCLLGLWLICVLQYGERIGEENTRILIGLQLLIGTCVGCAVNGIRAGKNTVSRSVILSVAFAILLLIGGLCIEGPIKNVAGNLLGIGIGCGISCVLCLKKTKRKGKRKSIYR